MKVGLIFSGRQYNVAQYLPKDLTLPDGASLDDALQALASLLPADQGLAASCMVAVSGTHLGTVASHRPRVLRDGDELLVLAPVAGG